MNEYLTAVKAALNITGEDQDAALLQWIEEALEFVKDAGVKPENIAVSDICTQHHSDLLWSHRATKGDRGTMCAMLRINPATNK